MPEPLSAMRDESSWPPASAPSRRMWVAPASSAFEEFLTTDADGRRPRQRLSGWQPGCADAAHLQTHVIRKVALAARGAKSSGVSESAI